MADCGWLADMYPHKAEEAARKESREILMQGLNSSWFEDELKRSYAAILQKALLQVLDSLRDKGLENSNPNFSCLGLQGPRPTDPNIENPIQYIFSLRGVELGRFWFTNLWTGTSVTITPHLVWVEGVDEIIERLL